MKREGRGLGCGPCPLTQLYSAQRRRGPGVGADSEASVSSQILNLGLSCLFDPLHCVQFKRQITEYLVLVNYDDEIKNISHQSL